MILSIIFTVAIGVGQKQPPMPADIRTVMSRLEAGNARFVKGNLRHPRQDPTTRRALVKGQKPQTIVVCCSDSRVTPETAFDQGLGDLFVIRTAGECLDFSAVASIEYAVAHLHPKLLLVLGHDYCGAVSATLTTKPGQSAGSPDLDKLVATLRPHLKGMTKTDDRMVKAVTANATGSLKDLLTRSKIVRDAVAAKQMAAKSGVYMLKSGVVTF